MSNEAKCKNCGQTKRGHLKSARLSIWYCTKGNNTQFETFPTFKDGTPDVGLAGLARLLKKKEATHE